MSLGKDLASVRKSQNLTLEDIQNAVKIPLDTLKSIESDRIFSDQDKNNTYIRSFVRSYAKVLKIDDADVVKALDEVEAGTYSGSILRDTSHSPEDLSFSPSQKQPEEKNTTKPEVEKTSPEPNSAPPIKPPVAKPDTIEWADLSKSFNTATKSSKAWVIIVSIIVLVIVIGGAAYYFWGNADETGAPSEPATEQQTESDNNQTQNAIPPATSDSTEISEQANPAFQQEDNTPSGPIELGDTLTVTVYAAYGQLEPVRVTSDLNWTTNPFWMEDGEAYNFDFRDTLLVRGQYSRLLLLFNDHVIENPRQNYFNNAFNSIMITRDVIDQPRYLAPAPEEFPLDVGAPDSTIYRIRF